VGLSQDVHKRLRVVMAWGMILSQRWRGNLGSDVHKCLYGPFDRILSMDVGWDELEVYSLVADGVFECV
jgi:hypothetical protein